MRNQQVDEITKAIDRLSFQVETLIDVVSEVADNDGREKFIQISTDPEGEDWAMITGMTNRGRLFRKSLNPTAKWESIELPTPLLK